MPDLGIEYDRNNSLAISQGDLTERDSPLLKAVPGLDTELYQFRKPFSQLAHPSHQKYALYQKEKKKEKKEARRSRLHTSSSTPYIRDHHDPDIKIDIPL
ncbi:uncharacterized protein RSE6_11727 [Rhynchosporium secalis]|uniref:Uncharacterized protein n=1 Tax=Rhynchosporium secalis TaxID=38038 RepID=A0A1E1MPM9_RHYSE|nr:uncharacterized protein RSE6_11727 [Rhynchosporium secalis]